MARFYPPTFPPQLSKPALAGERVVWQALLDAKIADSVHLFYNRRPKGSHRAPDALWVDYRRGVINIEVKGGLVHFCRAAFRQRIATGRKRIDPWQQAKRALTDLFEALGLDGAAIPHAVILAVPVMHDRAFAFAKSPFILTADDLPDIAARIEALLPVLDAQQQDDMAPALARICAALTRRGDAPPDPLAGYASRQQHDRQHHHGALYGSVLLPLTPPPA